MGSISRVPADQIEALLTQAVRDRLTKSGGKRSGSLPEQHAVAAHIAKVEVRTKHLAVILNAIESKPNHDCELARHDDAGTMSDQGEILLIPWTKPPMRKFREVIQPASASPSGHDRFAECRVGLIRAIAWGRQWLGEIVCGRWTIEQIAVRQNAAFGKSI